MRDLGTIILGLLVVVTKPDRATTAQLSVTNRFEDVGTRFRKKRSSERDAGKHPSPSDIGGAGRGYAWEVTIAFFSGQCPFA